MPVTVKIQDRNKDALPPATLDDFEQSGEQLEGRKAFALWMFSMLVLVSGLCAASYTREIGIIVLVWWIGACLWFFYFAPKEKLKKLRLEQKENRIHVTSHPRMQAVLAKGAGVLQVKIPECYLMPEGAPQIRVFCPPAFMTLTQASVDLVSPAELDCLILRHLVHFRQKHASRLMLMKSLSDMPTGLRLLAWPVGLYAFFLRMWWIDLAEMSADRITLLLIKNHKTISSALLKQHAATDPLMGKHNITSANVDDYMAQNGLISFEGREISIQYLLGQAIRENPYLDERLQAINNFAESPEFKEALQKLADARAARAPIARDN